MNIQQTLHRLTERLYPVHVPRSGAAPSRDHAVLFYDDARDAVARRAAYVVDGLHRQEAVVTVLRPSHTVGLLDALRLVGTDPEDAMADGRLSMLDAAATLESFMVDEMPDRQRFAGSVGDLFGRLAATGRPVRTAGEMVAILWAEGNVAGALALETAWNELAGTIDFELLCPYPATVLAASPLDNIGPLCALHSEVVAPKGYASGVDRPWLPTATTGVFVPAPEAVGATRRLVSGAMTEWSSVRGDLLDDRLVADACLVASEIAANAVTHARSAFEVTVSCSDSRVRVSVSDVGPGTAEEHRGRLLALSGRGLAIVAGLADRWGCDVLPGGKVVWAELVARRPVAL